LQSCYLHLDLLNLLLHLGDVVSICILLEGSNLSLKVHNPLKAVTSL
jgi:hypothetical protein